MTLGTERHAPTSMKRGKTYQTPINENWHKWQSNSGGHRISTKSYKSFSTLSLTCLPSSLTLSTGSKVNMRCPLLSWQLIEDRQMLRHKLRLCHDAHDRYYTWLAKSMQYLWFYLVLMQVDMFRKNTLKLWEFAERKLDTPFRCRDIQVSYSNTTLSDTNLLFPT